MTIDYEGEHRPTAIARHLACCFEAVGWHRLSGIAVEKSGRPLDVADYLSADREYRQRVMELCEFVNERLAEFITHFFLHGSLATLDYEKGWSDVDTFMVVRDETVKDPFRLLALRQRCLEAWSLFLKVAPLQHHGFMLVTERDLFSYPSGYLPLPVFDSALSILRGQGPLRFYVRSKRNGALRSLIDRRDAVERAMHDGVLRHHPKNGVYLMSHYRNAEDAMFQLYCLLGYVMTVPGYFLDACGEACNKRESFARARRYFSDEAWSIIDRASAIRRAWAEREGVSFSGNAIPEWVRNILGPDYIEDAFRLLDEAVRVVKLQLAGQVGGTWS